MLEFANKEMLADALRGFAVEACTAIAWIRHMNWCLKKTAAELLVLCKAFLAALRSALTAQLRRCEEPLKGFAFAKPCPALGTHNNVDTCE